jgi:hypothetical protein
MTDQITIDKKIIQRIHSAIDAALLYENITKGKRKLGITGETDPRSEGFDAIDKDGKHVQIKTRRSESEGLPRIVGRVSRFSGHNFDCALLAILDKKYSLCQIWRASYNKLKPIIEKEQTDRSGPKLASFMKAGEKVFDKKCSK